MNIKETAQSIGGCALWIVLTIVGAVVLILLFRGVVWIADKILPWLFLASVITFVFNLFFVAPFAFFSSTRKWACYGFFFSSYIFGITGWFMGFLLTWSIWGMIAVIIGLVILGVGVVPIALLATLLNGMWFEFGLLIAIIILTFGLRSLSVILGEETL